MQRTSRRRLSRTLSIVALVVVVAGACVTIKKIRPTARVAPPMLATGSAAIDQTPPPPPVPTTRPVNGAGSNAAQPQARQGKADSRQGPSNGAATRAVPAAARRVIATSEPALVLGANPLGDAKAKFDAGDLVLARRILNEAMLAGRFAGADAGAAKDLIGKASQQIVLGRRVFAGDVYTSAYTVQPREMLDRIASANAVTGLLLARINGIADPTKLRASQTIKLVRGPFHAVVTKSKFTMDIYLGAPGGAGSMLVMCVPVGLGKDDSTPAGTWIAGRRSKDPAYYSPRGEGIIQPGDPRNPLGRYWVGLNGIEGAAVGKQSYGIHGTNDPATIGKQESMGCIRLRNDDIALVFEMMVEGKSRVVVKENAE